MILAGYSWIDVVLYMLLVSAILLILVIAYRKLLARFKKDAVVTENYCILYALEQSPAAGELEFYFTCEKPHDFSMLILDENMDEVKTVKTATASPGGNIVRFDSTTLSNGNYFYCLKTDNQKTMKKMHVLNA